MMKKTMTAIVGSIAMIVLFSAAALADPGHGKGSEKRDGNNGHGSCVTQCVRIAQACSKGARDTRRACAKECAPERMAVEQACGDDDGEEMGEGDGDAIPTATATPSAECTAAEEALAVCLRPCREANRDARRTCRTAFHTCLTSACGIARQPTPTPTTPVP